MSIAEHTPTPWTGPGECAYGWDIRTTNNNGILIGRIHNSHDSHEGFPSDDEGLANRDFVLRAVNSHEGLVEALEWLTNCVSGVGKAGGKPEENELRAAMISACAIIA